MQQQQTLSEVIISVNQCLEKHGYSKSSIESFNCVFNQLRKYALEQGREYLDFELGMKFLSEHYGLDFSKKLSRTENGHHRGVQLLLDYQSSGIIFGHLPRKTYTYPQRFRAAVLDFIEQRKKQGIAPSNIQVSQLHLERFCFYLSEQHVESLSEIQGELIHGFVKAISLYGKPTKDQTLRTIRQFLKHCFEQKLHTEDLSGSVPHVPYQTYCRIPSAYTKDEVAQLLGTVDRGSAIGKRDYAILMLASRLGLRSSDILHLKFEDVKWEQNKIEIIQQKTKNFLSLPLLEDVGNAIIEYLKYGRPATECQTIFIRHVRPFVEFSPRALYTMVARYFWKSGIIVPNGKSHGPHSLRHSLATALMEADVPLPTITGILGQLDEESTRVYIKVDIAKLKECALEVPDYEIN